MILFDIRMTTAACFLGPFAWKNCFPAFYSKVESVFVTEVSCMQQNVGSCLCNQSVSLCLFIGELILVILRDIMQKQLLLPVIFVVRFGVLFLWLSSFWFVGSFLSCFF